VEYRFKVISVNVMGRSEASEALTLTCAFRPYPPLTINVINVDTDIQITWQGADPNGASLMDSQVFLRHKDLGFTDISDKCN
jgi:hypothetical protein